MTHELKIMDYYADAVHSGDKQFELRYNDRGYQKGDIIRFKVMQEGTVFDSVYYEHPLHGKEYLITYVLAGFGGLTDGWCVLGIKPYGQEQ